MLQKPPLAQVLGQALAQALGQDWDLVSGLVLRHLPHHRVLRVANQKARKHKKGSRLRIVKETFSSIV